MTTIYMDYAAATPLDPAVQKVMQPFLSEQFYNPSANYTAARAVKNQLDAARGQVAHWLGGRPSEIIFTAGGTEANNLAIHGIMRAFPAANMVVSAIEHSAVSKPAAHYQTRTAPVTPQGIVDLDALMALVDDQTVLISVMYANNEIGTVQPIKQLTQCVAEIRKQRLYAGNKLPLYVHSDACQASNYLDMHTARLGVDLMTLNGGKIYGPKQSGCLFVRGGIVLQPLIDGGGQERGLRSGTENVAACIGFAAALETAQKKRHSEGDRLQLLQRLFIKLVQEQLPEAAINGSLSRRLPNNVHLTLPGHDNERILIALDEAGVMAAAGSACSASSQEASAVLAALGLDDDTARASLRFSMGRSTTEDEVRATVAALVRAREA